VLSERGFDRNIFQIAIGTEEVSFVV